MGIGANIYNFGVNTIAEAENSLQSGLELVDEDDPKGLIRLQVLAFLFTNTVQSISGTLQSVSTATQAAAQRVGQ